ncbi:MAG: tetratricopeptide repeat protein [Alphaproteobacteria bacterium]|nr:tetratricopeptide repeat protein [Alphaproteobacteria bacterium]
MKNFEYIYLFLFFVALFAPIAIWYWRTRLKYLQKLVILNVLRRQQKNEYPQIFSSAILKRCTTLLYVHFGAKYRLALTNLVGGRIEKAVKLIKKQDNYLALLLMAHTNTAKAYKTIARQKKKFLQHPQYGVYYPLMAHTLFDLTEYMQSVEFLAQKKLSFKAGAYFNYISAFAYLSDGDMLSASHNASEALKQFRKLRYSPEEAQTYLLLAEIYRVSCVNDIARTMLASALKIYQQLDLKQNLAKTIAAHGMLMLFENRPTEAEQKYTHALSIAPTTSLKADINNQQSLLFLTQNRLKEANKYAATALNTHQILCNTHQKAFSLQLLAQTAFRQKYYNKTLNLSKQAAKLYLTQGNYSAYAESLYLGAEALYKQKKFSDAEKILRKIIELTKYQHHNFHTANAYSLLGLIYLHSGDLQRAKVLLQQSIGLEQNHNRCSGLVADYVNLALIEDLSGNSNQAKENMQIALEYAKQTQDEELIKLIEKRKKLSTDD